MKLIRFGEAGKERPGLLLNDGTRIDASAFGSDYNEAFFATGGLNRLRDWVAKDSSSASRVDSGVRLGPPIARPSKIVCIGLNFRDHAAETGAKIPTEPVIFFKSTTALVGPNDPLMIPRDADKVDWEVEFAIIIGKRVNYVEKSDALNYVAGYALHNDYSERGFQKDRGGQWVKGKSCDTFAPLGPFLATADEIPDPRNLKMWLKVNGVLRQNSSTANMIFDAATLVSYVSQFMTLLPGDVISTGTPAGVALGMKTPEYLKAGDVVELGVENLAGIAPSRFAFSETELRKSRQLVAMRIDAHQHFWRYNPDEYGWIDDSMASLRRYFLLQISNLNWIVQDSRRASPCRRARRSKKPRGFWPWRKNILSLQA